MGQGAVEAPGSLMELWWSTLDDVQLGTEIIVSLAPSVLPVAPGRLIGQTKWELPMN